jgi:hypothetical protein
MNRSLLSALAIAVVLAAGCGKKEEAPQAPATPAAPAAPVQPAPPPQAVGDSCSQDCGGGKVASITCAQGETPVCDCQATPNALCKVPPAAAEPKP